MKWNCPRIQVNMLSQLCDVALTLSSRGCQQMFVWPDLLPAATVLTHYKNNCKHVDFIWLLLIVKKFTILLLLVCSKCCLFVTFTALFHWVATTKLTKFETVFVRLSGKCWTVMLTKICSFFLPLFYRFIHFSLPTSWAYVLINFCTFCEKKWSCHVVRGFVKMNFQQNLMFL